MQIEVHRAALRGHGYEMKHEIGRGGFANVYLVSSERYGREFAAKVSRNKGCLTGEDETEIKSLMNLQHPNIINMYDFFVEGGELYVILEYCPLGNLRSYIKKNGKMTGRTLHQFCSQLASALRLCHSLRIAHRDIKPENVLIDYYGRPKLADFGLGMFCSGPNHSTANVNGSLSYSPPEYFREVHNNPFKSDIWSLGILFYYMATGHVPWHTKTREGLVKEITEGGVELNEGLVGAFLNRLLRKMLDSNSKHRPDIEEVATMIEREEKLGAPGEACIRTAKSMTIVDSPIRVKKPVSSFSPRPVYFTCPKPQSETPSRVSQNPRVRTFFP